MALRHAAVKKSPAKRSRRKSGRSSEPVMPESREDQQNRAVCRAVFQAAENLKLSHEELADILGVDDRTTKRWQSLGKILSLNTKAVREPTQHFLGVYAQLVEMFSAPEDREAWIKSTHPVLNDVPLSLMIESFESLAAVRRYVEYVSSRGA